jgi:hypothetical protein
MAKAAKYEYPPDGELQALFDEVGVTEAARQLKIPVSTLSSYARDRKLRGARKSKHLDARSVELAEEISEEERLKQRVQELETQVKRDRKAEIFDDRVAGAIEDALATRKVAYSPRAIPKSKASKTKHEFALNWSDLHAGEVVSLEETGGINQYDWATMLKRHDTLRESLFSYQDNRSYPVEDLHVFGLGDMLSGNIHDELVATNEIPLAEAVVQLGMDGAEWLESLLERFQRIHFSGVVGNHPRAHKKPWAKQGYDNADWTAYNIMRLVLRKNKRITFDIPKASQHRVTVAGKWNGLLWHGDQVSSSMVGVPWGGIIRRVAQLRNQYQAAGQPCHFYCCGHFHTANSVEGGEINVNGSIKGLDEYGLKRYGGGRPPQQLLLTFHPERGMTDASFVDCA